MMKPTTTSFILWASNMESAMQDPSVSPSHNYIVICFAKAMALWGGWCSLFDDYPFNVLINNATMHYIIVDFAPSSDELDNIEINDNFKKLLATKYKTTSEPNMPTSSVSSVSSSVSRAVVAEMDSSTAGLLETKYGHTVFELTKDLNYIPIWGS